MYDTTKILPLQEILGVKIHEISLQGARMLCEAWLFGHTAHQVVTVNPEFVVEAQANDNFKSVLNTADLCIADGVGLLYASRFLGHVPLSRVTGVDLSWELARLCFEQGKAMYLVGGAYGVAEKTAMCMNERYPHVVLAAEEGIPESIVQSDVEEATRALVARINAIKPDVILVAFGAPRQDLWIDQHLSQLVSVKIAMGVGGTFDYISGVLPRAPQWMRILGLEWLYRVVRQPQRITRIATATVLFPLLVIRSKYFDK